MTKDEALKLALEKFEFMNHVDSIFEGEFNFQINAIKEALAQPEHDKTDVRCECCGYMTYHREHLGCIRAAKLKEPEQEPVAFEKTVCPFCASEWVTAEQHDRNVDRVERTPLTDKDIASIFKAQRMVYNTDGVPFARAIEAAHGIKGEA